MTYMYEWLFMKVSVCSRKDCFYSNKLATLLCYYSRRVKMILVKSSILNLHFNHLLRFAKF